VPAENSVWPSKVSSNAHVTILHGLVIVKPQLNFDTDVADSLRSSPPMTFSRTTICKCVSLLPRVAPQLHHRDQSLHGADRTEKNWRLPLRPKQFDRKIDLLDVNQRSRTNLQYVDRLRGSGGPLHRRRHLWPGMQNAPEEAPCGLVLRIPSRPAPVRRP
jgi:hypothetical protein